MGSRQSKVLTGWLFRGGGQWTLIWKVTYGLITGKESVWYVQGTNKKECVWLVLIEQKGDL